MSLMNWKEGVVVVGEGIKEMWGVSILAWGNARIASSERARFDKLHRTETSLPSQADAIDLYSLIIKKQGLQPSAIELYIIVIDRSLDKIYFNWFTANAFSVLFSLISISLGKVLNKLKIILFWVFLRRFCKLKFFFWFLLLFLV